MKQLKITQQITSRDNQSLDRYLQEISKVPLITPEDEVELAVRIRQGDHQALERLTKANLRFVISVAKQYQFRGLPLNDLINEGNLGLVKAATRFDERRGFKFISYAVWWIRQAIFQALAEQSRVVRLPLNRVGTLNRTLKAFAELEQKFQREPTADELAELLEIPVDDVELAGRVAKRQVSIDAPLNDEESNTLLDTMHDRSERAPDAELDLDSLKSEISSALAALTLREAEVLRAYYGLDGCDPMTLEALGIKLALTRERVRQIKDKATRRLRVLTSSKILRTYLN
ncbi:MAG: RNA polymerase sigma factor RpoD/SigA [Cyclobacteriaceae bacterium]